MGRRFEVFHRPWSRALLLFLAVSSLRNKDKICCATFLFLQCLFLIVEVVEQSSTSYNEDCSGSRGEHLKSVITSPEF